MFNCPQCNNLLKFNVTTAISQRCSRCHLVIYVGLRLSVRAKVGGRVRRPADTILPPMAKSGPRHPALMEAVPLGDDAYVDESVLADASIEPMPEVELGRWSPGEPFHELVVEEADGFVAEAEAGHEAGGDEK